MANKKEREIKMSEIKLKESVVIEAVQNFVDSDIVKFNFYRPEIYTVIDKETLGDAEKNIKIAKSELARIKEVISEKKKFFDAAKKPLLDKEKEIEKLASESVQFFEKSIQDYKQKELERQQLINRLCNEINQYKSAVIQNLTNIYNQSTQGIELLESKCNAVIQARQLQDAASAGVEIDSEIIESIEQVKEAEIVPVEIVTQEKNFVQTNAIQKKESYSIRDEAAYIEYAKENKLWHLLDIKPAKAGFNLWVKEAGNKNKPFVLITESLK